MEFTGKAAIEKVHDDSSTDSRLCSRRELLVGALASGLSLSLPIPVLARIIEGEEVMSSSNAITGTGNSDRKPNIVLIFIDDMGWVDAGCYGSKFFKTPNIDRLAAEGMRFTDGYSASPVCSPTRAALMTGKDPARLHLTSFSGTQGPTPQQKLKPPTFEKRLTHDEAVIAKVLKSAGYVSACIGKWDLGGRPYFPEDHGFDVSFGAMGGGMVPTHFYPWGGHWNVEGKEGEYLTDRLTEEAENFIEANKEKPFFLYLSHYAVHLPLEGKEEVIEKYQDKVKPDEGQNNPVYAAMMESVDDCVGRIMAKLEETGVADNTVLIFTSDNGGLDISELGYAPATSNAPLRDGKGRLYEGGIRVPLIVRWPGKVQAGSECAVPVSTYDFYPTMLDIAGVEQKEQIVDGENIVPLLKGGDGLERDAIYWHFPHYGNQGGAPGSAIRQDDFKLIKFYEDNNVELYNLGDDVGEKNNLADKMPEKAAVLRKKLEDWLKSVDAQMPTRNPDYSPP